VFDALGRIAPITQHIPETSLQLVIDTAYIQFEWGAIEKSGIGLKLRLTSQLMKGLSISAHSKQNAFRR